MLMNIPVGKSGILSRAASSESADAGRPARKAASGPDAFRKILESQLAPVVAIPSGKSPAEVAGEKNIRQLIEIIRLRMMLDEHVLDFMRGKGDDQSLYQRFARWQAGGLDAVTPRADTAKPAAAAPTVNAEEAPSMVRVRKASDRSSPYEPIIQQASQTYGVDPALIRAVIRAESNFKNESTSPKGAMGLMQIMPVTAKDLGIRDAYDPQENIMGGTRYLKSLLDRYNGDVPTALAAYNWGMGNVERRPEKLPRETRFYISRIQQFLDEGPA
jgi:soluble lytic murein transglycosylase-like protein